MGELEIETKAIAEKISMEVDEASIEGIEVTLEERRD